MENLSHIGIAGLAVMGENLALNIESKGFSVSVYNRTTAKTDRFLTGRGKDKNISGFPTLESFVASLESPRKIMLMLKAGKVVDDFIDKLLPLLNRGDIIIDGGNSNYHDTIRRVEYLENQEILFIGSGVSGGEIGALRGPSLMPGGTLEAWRHVEPIFTEISAKVEDGSPCCAWIGKGGAGHFVKMVHNGIEYGDMQLICETYHIMKNLLKMSADEMHHIFAGWNKGELSSYLIEITGNILAFKDEDGRPLVDKIVDTAGQKGTGKWTVAAALDFGVPLSLISEAVFARCLSAARNDRIQAAAILQGPSPNFSGDRNTFLDKLEKALYLAKIISYTQGFNLMQTASEEYGWDLDYSEIARIWRGGCIIRSQFLDKISDAYINNLQLSSLLLDPFFMEKIGTAQQALRDVIITAVQNGISVPSHTSALQYLDGFRTARLPANLLQAQRDYFGAHTYERLDKPRGKFFHTDWTGQGGDTTSSGYST